VQTNALLCLGGRPGTFILRCPGRALADRLDASQEPKLSIRQKKEADKCLLSACKCKLSLHIERSARKGRMKKTKPSSVV